MRFVGLRLKIQHGFETGGQSYMGLHGLGRDMVCLNGSSSKFVRPLFERELCTKVRADEAAGLAVVGSVKYGGGSSCLYGLFVC